MSDTSDGSHALPSDTDGARLDDVELTLERVRRALLLTRRSQSAARMRVFRSDDPIPDAPDPVRRVMPEEIELGEAVTAYVQRLADAGVSPERMLALVKTAVHESQGGSPDILTSRALMDTVVRLSIAVYFRR